jgi:asparagine synthase (glutamine-hydrolysing)
VGGLFGILGDASESELAAMGQRLAHRGQGLHTWSPAPGVHLAQLGGDLDPDHAVAFDGHLYDRPALREQLGLPRDANAAQIFARLLAQQGPLAAGALSGQFAAAWWDAAHRRLVLLRDRFAVRPLYITQQRGRWIFASEYKALLALPDVPALPDRDAIRHLQCTRMPKSDATFLAGIAPVPRAAASELGPQGLRVEKLGTRAVRIVPRSDAEHVEALRGSFLSALARQSEDVERFGLQLSGGFDSALVFAGLRALRPFARLHTFTAGYGPDDPEVVSARKLAGQLGSEHHELVLEPGQLPPLLPRTVWHMEDPYGREDQVYLHLLVGEAAKHVDVLFAGYGADTCMAGMPRHRVASLALRVPALRIPLAGFYHYTQTGEVPREPLGRALVELWTRGKRVAPPRVIGSRYRPHREELRRDGPEPLTALLARLLDEECGWEAIETLHAAQRLRFDAPFMDPAFLDVAFSIPDRLKIRGGTQKWALREAGRGLLPAEVLARRKTLQRLRHDEQLADVLDELAARWLAPADVAARGLFEPDDVARVRRRRSGRAYSEAQAHRLWTLLVSELWCRLFLDARGAPPA